MIEQKPHELAAARIAQAAAAKNHVDAKANMQAAERDLQAQLSALKQANDLEEQRLRIENLRQVNSDTYLNSIQVAYNTLLGMFSQMQVSTSNSDELSEVQSSQLVKLGEVHCTLIDRLHAFWIREEQNHIVNDLDNNEELPEEKEQKEILLSLGFSEFEQNSIEKWLDYKKEKKQLYKQTGLNTLLTKMKDEKLKGCDIVGVINISMLNNWQGLFFDKGYSQNSIAPDDEEKEAPGIASDKDAY